jgi:tetratricopeptide (TPR) repeat protein
LPFGPDPLDALFSEESGALPSLLFRGYISHALLFYRQNDLHGFRELVRLGRDLKLGPGGNPKRSSSSVADGPGWDEALRAVRRLDERAAVRLLTSAIKRAPKTAAFRVLRGFVLGENHWGSRRLSAASIADFEAALRLDPGQLWARMGLGMALEMRRRFARARAQFEAAAALAPAWAWPRVFRGVCQWYLAEPRQATASFALAARLDPRSELPLLFMARAKADYRDRSLVKDLDRALALAPESGFALSWRGRAMFVLQRTPEALADLKRSIAALPDYDRGWSWLGVSLVEQGRLKPAAPLLRKARALNPHYPTTLYPLAGALMRLGRWEEGGRVMREAAAVDRSGVWVEHRISMSHPNPACLRSRADLDRYIDKRPKAAWAWAWRGQTELLLQNYAKALADLDRAAALDPRDAWARLWRGETRRRVGDFAAALSDFEGALRLDPSLSWARAGRGDCLLAAGRPREALAALDRSLAAQDYCAPAHALRGRALLALGRAADAAGAFAASLELHPQDRWVARLRALSLALCGRWEEALAAFGGVGHSDDDAALAAYLLARCGRRGEARAAAARALSRNPAHPLARAVRAGRAPRAPEALSSLAQGDPAAAFGPGVLAETAARAGLKKCARSLRRGDLAAALAAADGESRLRDAGLYRLRGWLKLSSGDAAGAVEDASRALDATLDPSDRAALWLRSRAWSALGGRPLSRVESTSRPVAP